MMSIQASPVAVANASFEDPNSKQQNWDGGTNAKGTFVDVPGWSSDTMAQDSGIEGPNAWPGDTDGVMAGYLMGSDPSAWNKTSYIIEAGDAFVLKVDSRDNWSDASVMPAKLQMTLFCVSAGQRIPLATRIVNLTTTWTTFSLLFNMSESPACVGLNIGIELKNAIPTNNSWIGMDNVRLLNLMGR